LKRRTVLTVLLLGVIIVASFSFYEFYYSKPSCQAVPGGSVARSQLAKVQFGAVTEYKLPGPDRWPDAVTSAPDGSVWFAERELPGVAHFFPSNGTVAEYAWPGYPAPKLPDCIPSVIASGITLWNGRVWASDEYGNLVVGVSPSGGHTVNVNTTGKAPNPFLLAVGPEGSLWFTSFNTPAMLGRIAPDMTLTIVNLVGLGHDEPFQLNFVNSSLAYLSTLNESPNSTTHACICNGHIYAFDPSSASTTITPALVGGGYELVLPTSVHYSGGSLWVAQHGASSVVRYDLAAKSWTKYPTSVVPWLGTTLPLVIDGSQGRIWFNEHYANKISLLNPGAGTLTEFSESNPPASNYTDIQNDLSIVATGPGLWFTSLSGNYLGFVNSSYDPGVHVSISGTNAATIVPGQGVSFTVNVTGTWSSPMNVAVSDSEASSSKPNLIQIIPSVSAIPVGRSPYGLGVRLVADQKIQAGRYTVAVTLTNGGIQQTAYFFVVAK
jgi:streptogramin lyase